MNREKVRLQEITATIRLVGSLVGVKFGGCGIMYQHQMSHCVFGVEVLYCRSQ